MKRREFIKKASCSYCALMLADTIMPFRSALAHAADSCRTVNDHVLLHIIQNGGNDMANTLVPKNPAVFPSYFAKRPTLAITNALSLTGTTDYGLHPNLANLQQLYLQGFLAFVPKMGYPNQVSSHADATRNFAVARFDGQQDSTGWAGRIADALVNCGQSTDYSIVSFGGAVRDINSANYTAITAAGLSDVTPVQDYFRTYDNPVKNKAFADMAQADNLHNNATQRYDSAKAKFAIAQSTLKAANDAYSPAGYPTSTLGTRLKDFAKLMKAGIPGLKYCVVGHGGYDTHDNQLEKHGSLMRDLDNSLGALVMDLISMGKFQKVTILVESEFSRCVFENAGGGTDHGQAILAMLIGGSLRGGIYGPGYRDSDFTQNESFQFAVDFREIRGRIIEWLGVDPSLVFPGTWSNANVGSAIIPTV